MKRIGIITIQKCDNFGADLQAYALGAKLRSMGYDAENIDYLFYKHPRHQKGTGENPVIRLTLVNRIKERLFPFVEKLRRLRHGGWAARKAQVQRAVRFAEWFKQNLPSSREYRSVSALYADPPKYDVYMVGSDQVWNPRMGSNIKPYFLDFAPKGARCVSYAASIGAAGIPAGAFYLYKKLLRRFSAIGVREQGAADIVRAMALGTEVKHVVDPTLLLNAAEWEKVSVRPAVFDESEPYVLLYDLIASEETVALAHKIAKERKLKVVRMGDGAYGPGEFIWLFAHAEFVVTNSFHGTAFSLINRKDFYSVIPKGMANAGRIESVLHLVGADDRLVRADNVSSFGKAMAVNWASVQDKLNVAKDDSVAFLKHAVEGPDRREEPKLPLGCYAVWNADEKVRAASTSGGLFRVLAESIIAKGGVVYGAAFSEDFHRVEHRAAETIEALDPLMKSKYVWSDPTSAYEQVVVELKKGRSVLFTGTPCQVAAVKAVAKGVDEHLLTLDVVCHGTPRPEVFRSYVAELETRYGGKVKSYEFRNKKAGWNFPHIRCEFEDGEVYDSILRVDPYYQAFGLGVSFRAGCFNCPFVGIERKSDFTIADCWRIAASKPEWDDNQGTSLVLVNTPKASAIWKQVLESGKVKGGEYDLDLAQMRNMPLQQRALKPKCYEQFKRIFEETGSFAAAAKVFYSRRLIVKATIIYWVKKLGWFYFRRHQ